MTAFRLDRWRPTPKCPGFWQGPGKNGCPTATQGV